MTDEIKPLNLSSDSQAEKPAAGVKASMGVKPASQAAKKKMLAWFLMLVLLGVGSGYVIHLVVRPKTPKKLATSVEGELKAGDTFGVMDEEAFRDAAEGMLVSGGIDGEGSHHLEREGGESQNVYLTSSVIDLDQFLDKRVKVWGETFEAQKAGWLMDVGRLEVLE